MLSQLLKPKSDPATCGHDNTVITTNFGLQRVVCEACGQIEVRHAAPAESGQLFRVTR